jgi:hypothetical protein
MSNKELKVGDIYRWSYTEEEVNKRQDSVNAGTLYWCCSRIGIVKETETLGLFLEDTFWGSSCESRRFFVDYQEFPCNKVDILDLEFIANKEDLLPVSEQARFKYLDKDWVNLNHPNSTKGNSYIRKGSEPNKAKILKVMKRNKKIIESEIQYQLSQIKQLEEKIEKKDVEYFSPDSNTPVEDVSYYDEGYGNGTA